MFTVSENVPQSVSRILEDSLPTFHGLPLGDFLETVSECLDKATSPDGSVSDSVLLDSDPSDTEEENDPMDWEDEEEDIEVAFKVGESIPGIHDCIRSDLRKARQAGFRVGILGELDGAVILSASRRISKLGISNEAMEAWGVRPTDYLVLLVRYPYGYRRLPDVVLSAGTSSTIQLYVGVCEQYKPSLNSARHVFTTGVVPGLEDTDKVDMEPALGSILIGKSLQSLLKDRFTMILKYRLENGFSWTGAELYLNDGQGRLLHAYEKSHSKYFEPETWRVPPPDFLKDDHLAQGGPPSEMSLLLIAMQFTLRRFVKCTEFCLNCYCKIDAGFEALKPFVCSNGLCLYQYMSLGMGPSLEWEISSQPYVADLLISFAYTRIAGNKLQNFPTGFPLKVPHPGRTAINPANFSSTAYRGKLSYDDALGSRLCIYSSCDIRVGDWIVILVDYVTSDQAEIRNRQELHARVKNTADKSNVVLGELIVCGQRQSFFQLLKDAQNGPVHFVIYDTDLASLPDVPRTNALMDLLGTLPTVSEMKAWIDQKKGGHLRPLSEWHDRIHMSALYVLQWIIGSNRSVILFDDDPQNQVLGMESYMQFRFAQGAPDKEQRFVKAVNTTASRLNLQYSTLFAWHGSLLYNWHSIVREGLHYRNTMNGRSYGHGIYMTPNFNTSIGYCRNYRDGGAVSIYWPKSELNCTMAISLNEVVNAPAEFTSRDPHYVVQHVDWVQPRYLFIDCGQPMLDRVKQQKFEKLTHVYAQDPDRKVIGPRGALTIPISATNSHRSRDSVEASSSDDSKSVIKNGKRKKSSVDHDAPEDDDDAASVTTLPEDRQVLLSDDESTPRKQSKLSVTSFQPNTLDISSIQLLGEPAYATSRATKTLQKVLRQALDTQDKQPLHELGWYINSNHIDNVYQWIVELHSFDKNLQIARDLENAGLNSIVMEMRFPPEFPLSPPFLRIIKPRFVRFTEGGGGHITAGGAMCMELLTTSGWLPAFSIESVLLQVRLAITNELPRPARLDFNSRRTEYAIGEAIHEYKRVCIAHNWAIPKDLDKIGW